MLWGATTTVGFGIRGRYAVAWYCNKKGNIGAAKDYKANVGQLCVKDNSNPGDRCYNDRATLGINKLRVLHGSPKLTTKLDIANKIQAQMDSGMDTDAKKKSW